jgi:hypothetical protein
MHLAGDDSETAGAAEGGATCRGRGEGMYGEDGTRAGRWLEGRQNDWAAALTDQRWLGETTLTGGSAAVPALPNARNDLAPCGAGRARQARRTQPFAVS